MDLQEIAQNRFYREGKVRPSARRVAARAMVLSTIVCRSYLEQEHRRGDYRNARGSIGLLAWLTQSGLQSELEPDERRFLATPVGAASDRAMVDAHWRTEGLGVLAWALGRFELPPYDEQTNPDIAQPAISFLRPSRNWIGSSRPGSVPAARSAGSPPS
jgi:hypothetical protein